MSKKDNTKAADLESSREWAKEIAQMAYDRHCTDLVILELVDRSPVAKHFVLVTGSSSQRIRSVANEIIREGKDKGIMPFGRAGIQQGRWIVIDFVDVVVHLFDEEYRQFYDLEMLWGDAPRLEFEPEESHRHVEPDDDSDVSDEEDYFA